MKFRTSLFLALLAVMQAGAQQNACHCAGMTPAGKGSFYFGLGFHRIFYTKSDIRLRDQKTANYDFTLHRVKAIDDNSFDFGQGIDAPQYSYRIGYFFNNKKDLGIEFSFDHAKYIAVQDQHVRISGMIGGMKMNKDTIMHAGLLEYEHTDGANYYMLSLVKRNHLIHSRNEKHWLSFILKPGAGIVLPRSDTRVLGLHRDDRYHVAGYILGLDAGMRYDFAKHFYLEMTMKGAFANYKNVLLYGEGRASQKWWSLQPIFMLGFQFPA